MARLISAEGVLEDLWRWVPEEDAGAAALPRGERLIVPVSLWRAQRDALLARGSPLGLWLAVDEPLEPLAPDLPCFALIAVYFEVFSDGRGYSQAVLLRQRYAYKGELRAAGDVLRDQLFYLRRCGFDSFALRADQDAEEALQAFADFRETYQGAVDDPRPLFRRRAARH